MCKITQRLAIGFFISYIAVLAWLVTVPYETRANISDALLGPFGIYAKRYQ